MARHLSSVVPLLAALLLVTASSAAMVPYFVQVAHRHGARTPIVSFNESKICGPLGCGILNDEGKDMLVHGGAWLRGQYPQLFKSESYDAIHFSYSRSTDLKRTIQSADGLLRGAFPNLTTFYPVINTVNFLSDDLLLVDALPAYHVPSTVTNDATLEKIYDQVVALVDKDTIRQIGVELSYNEECSSDDKAKITRCALTCQDIAASYNAQGILKNYPTVSKNYPQLNQIRFLWNQQHFPYNKSNPMDAMRGSLGQNLAQTLIQNMIEATNKTTKSYTFMEYSAHDTTMMPLCTTFGHNDMLLPLFGQMYVFELAQDSEDKSKFGVRAFYGAPGQTPESHDYTMNVFNLTCIDKNGKTTVTATPNDYCQIGDLWRFINTSLPQSPEGLCYLPDSIKDQMGCTDAAPNATSLCAMYRTGCPQFACGDKKYINMGDLSCTLKGQPDSHVSVIAILTSLGGVLVGAVLGLAIPRFFSGSSSGSSGYAEVV